MFRYQMKIFTIRTFQCKQPIFALSRSLPHTLAKNKQCTAPLMLLVFVIRSASPEPYFWMAQFFAKAACIFINTVKLVYSKELGIIKQ